jgi:hypothetical protein
MNRAIVLCLAAVCLLSAGSAAHADQISYNFSTNYPSLFIENNHLGAFFLSDKSGVLPASIATTPAIIGTKVLAFSDAPHSDPQQLYAPIFLTLKDKTSSGTTLTDTLHLGVLTGPFSRQGSDLDFYSFGPKNVTFGKHTYKITVAMDSIQSTGMFLSQGRLSFIVTDPSNGPSGSTTPEPSGFVLAGLGVPLFGLCFRRRRV